MLKNISWLRKSFEFLKGNWLLIVAFSILLIIISTSNHEEIISTPTTVTAPHPIIVEWSSLCSNKPEIQICPNNKVCEIVSYEDEHNIADVRAHLFYGPNIHFAYLPLPRQYQNIIWAVYHEESPITRPELFHEKVHKLFNFSSTFSRYSDIPFTLVHAKSIMAITNKKYFVETSMKNLYLKQISPILYLQTNCKPWTKRDAYAINLMKYISVDSYGPCANNKQLPNNLTRLNQKLYNHDFLKFIARYKFMIAIENGICDDYISEKLWRPIHLGVVPIYFGSPSIRDWLPNKKSAILLKEFPTPKIMSEHIKNILRDDNLYNEHLEHKTQGKITNRRLLFELPRHQGYNKLKSDFECLICKNIYDLKNKTEPNVMNKSHFNCPKPVSAVTLTVDPSNVWVDPSAYHFNCPEVL